MLAQLPHLYIYSFTACPLLRGMLSGWQLYMLWLKNMEYAGVSAAF